MGVPGLWIVAPSVVSSPGDLLRQAALDCDAPVIFIENKTCYGRELIAAVPGMTRSELRTDDSPFPTVWLRHDPEAEADGLLWCYGGMAPHALEAVRSLRETEGLSVDLAVISQLSPVPHTHLARIVEQTAASQFIYVEEASVEHGWSAEILASAEQQLAEASRTVRHLRIGGAHTPIPSSRVLETAALPDARDIAAAIVNCF